ncbi:MFS transporter [Paenibacillus chitinolyticus]|uniref:MFS transporter n=1 Tax=Paenibacillus chitinolyticus TaxID=79263 RepID=UPI002DB6ABDC|nr:MFS transporter [Paenibacillus chitinolyticus]MEC0248583.1 MFS transporter [Paenibacillus chitinolyticus]
MSYFAALRQYPKESWFFLFASFINSLGSSFMWPLTTLYVHNVLGRSFGEAGLVLLIQSLASVAGQIAGGILYDRLGVKRLVVGSLMAGSAAQLALIPVSGWYAYMALMAAIGFLNAVSMPAVQAYVGFRWKERRRELFNLIYVGNNIGMAIGTSIAGLLASWFSFSVNFLVNGLSTLAFALFFSVFMTTKSSGPVSGGEAPEEKAEAIRSAWQLLSNVKLYLFMAGGSMFIWFSTSVWNSGIASHIDAQNWGMASYSFLWTVNGILIFAGQPFLGWLKKHAVRSLPAQMTASAMFYAAGFSLLLVSQSYRMMIAGMIVTTFGEMLIAPAMPAFITEKTGRSSPFYLGVVQAVSLLGRLLGPYALGTLYDRSGVRSADDCVCRIGCVRHSLCPARFF